MLGSESRVTSRHATVHSAPLAGRTAFENLDSRKCQGSLTGSRNLTVLTTVAALY